MGQLKLERCKQLSMVMVVDCDPISRHLLQQTLTQAGFLVVSVANGSEVSC